MNSWINFEYETLESDIQHLENEIHQHLSVERPYTIRARTNPMHMYSENEFRRRFRLSKATVQYLYSLIGANLEPLVTRENFTISGLDKILITLRYYATASFYLVAGDFFGVSEASVCNIVPIVSEKIAALSDTFIQMPSTSDEIEANKRNFFRVAGMPCIIGAVDGTLVKIQEVGGSMNKTMFFCRKQYYAINTQIVCDAQAKVLNIVARWPGAIHDETVFLHSRLYERISRGEFNQNQRSSILLGDGGYRAEPFLATPLRATNDLSRRSERLYQTAHISTRNVVERFMGQWKRRFPCLWIGMRCRKLTSIQNIIVATAVLHNICKMRNDTQIPPLSRAEEIRYNAAIAVEREFRDTQPRRRQPNTIQNKMLKRYFERIANEQQ